MISSKKKANQRRRFIFNWGLYTFTSHRFIDQDIPKGNIFDLGEITTKACGSYTNNIQYNKKINKTFSYHEKKKNWKVLISWLQCQDFKMRLPLFWLYTFASIRHQHMISWIYDYLHVILSSQNKNTDLSLSVTSAVEKTLAISSHKPPDFHRKRKPIATNTLKISYWSFYEYLEKIPTILNLNKFCFVFNWIILYPTFCLFVDAFSHSGVSLFHFLLMTYSFSLCLLDFNTL